MRSFGERRDGGFRWSRWCSIIEDKVLLHLREGRGDRLRRRLGRRRSVCDHDNHGLTSRWRGVVALPEGRARTAPGTFTPRGRAGYARRAGFAFAATRASVVVRGSRCACRCSTRRTGSSGRGCFVGRRALVAGGGTGGSGRWGWASLGHDGGTRSRCGASAGPSFPLRFVIFLSTLESCSQLPIFSTVKSSRSLLPAGTAQKKALTLSIARLSR